MTTLDVILKVVEVGAPVVAYLITYHYQKQKIQSLTDAIDRQKTGLDGQKAAIEAQTSSVNALKAQADGQAAITTKLEGMVDRTERYASTILDSHDKVVQLLKTKHEHEKQLMQEELGEARSQLVSREKHIQEVDMPVGLAEVLSSLSSDSYAMREMMSSLRQHLNEIATINANSGKLGSQLSGISDRINELIKSSGMTNQVPLFNKDKPWLPFTSEDKRQIQIVLHQAPRDERNRLVVNRAIMKLQPYFASKGIEWSLAMYLDIEEYGKTLGLGEFISMA